MRTVHVCIGAEVGDALSRHALVRKVGFTGSTEIGKRLMERCALTAHAVHEYTQYMYE